MTRVKRHISGLSDSEYVDLLRKLSEQQYSETIEEDDYDVDPLADVYSGFTDEDYAPSFKPKRVTPNSSICLDLSKAPLATIKEKLHTTGNISIGPFLIRIKRYDSSESGVKLDIDIMEERSRTYAGQVGKMTEKVNMTNDSRFSNKAWAKLFANPMKCGTKLPLDTVAEIIKFLQFVYKNPAFL